MRAGCAVGGVRLHPPAPSAAQAQVAEVAAVSAHFAEPSGLAATGATIAGVKYMFVRGEPNEVIQTKKVSPMALARARRCPPSHPSTRV